VDSIYANREQLVRSGCPLGGLCSELHQEGGTLAKKSATLFTEPISCISFMANGPELLLKPT
jgi:hypothetical protein